MRASRLVNLLLLLQSRGGLTAGELAAELEVSIRTVHRDVEALSAAGVPIYADRGPHGGIRLVDGYRTRLTGLTADEAEALFLAGLPGPAAQLGLGTVVAAAQLKVMAALPPELRSRASRLVERFHLDPSGWFQASDPLPHLGVLAEAVWDGRAVAIIYRREEDDPAAVERVIHPLGLVLKAGVWYLVAAGDRIRTYRVARVTSVRPLDEPVVRPDDFDLTSHWAATSAAYERDAPTVDVVVRFRPDRTERLRDVVGDAVWSTAERLDVVDAEDWWHMRLRMPWPPEVPGRLLAAGSGVEVLEPVEIRTALVAAATRIIERYDRPGGYRSSDEVRRPETDG
jgi:predicted DNA-binding transcriptional regulator YafY